MTAEPALPGQSPAAEDKIVLFPISRKIKGFDSPGRATGEDENVLPGVQKPINSII